MPTCSAAALPRSAPLTSFMAAYRCRSPRYDVAVRPPAARAHARLFTPSPVALTQRHAAYRPSSSTPARPSCRRRLFAVATNATISPPPLFTAAYKWMMRCRRTSPIWCWRDTICHIDSRLKKTAQRKQRRACRRRVTTIRSPTTPPASLRAAAMIEYGTPATKYWRPIHTARVRHTRLASIRQYERSCHHQRRLVAERQCRYASSMKRQPPLKRDCWAEHGRCRLMLPHVWCSLHVYRYVAATMSRSSPRPPRNLFDLTPRRRFASLAAKGSRHSPRTD
jgi:hypothetical protein